ncbi:bifunctional 5,10-methylenetetrahydrofolate dehydrogenase/5,10-methenyltetrahydrofolate cyclohydrolase [Vagococcus elongatus]|uniref:Bifunctional protein FolD n=1 Tax=Vagococcus elongatus TaxID=180344 RepID=A0A430AYC3_9ENTE|nr:bifunctional 5,10-methylenetetrahydrofolate dehydrogenase/5,10-methenyltetrahydrofolate cyclohydrolase [Vagococcus elongatus]RSU13044.1 hypothetical protein CBF29_05075 [Vagococcus elongatus]
MTVIMDGKKISAELQDGLKRKVSEAAEDIRVVTLGFHETPSFLYKRRKKLADKLGIVYDYHLISPADSHEIMTAFSQNQKISGLVLDGEIPDSLDEFSLRLAMAPDKDMEGFHPINQGKLLLGEKGLVPPTPLAAIALLKAYDIPINGKHVVVFGRGKVVGKPLIPLLLKENATVTVLHSRSKEPEKIASQADIVISAVGKPRFINGDYIKEGAVVVDIGMSTDESGNLSGDVDSDAVMGKAGYLSLVKGGISPLGLTMFMKQIVDQYK